MSSKHEQFNPLKLEKPQAIINAEHRAEELAGGLIEQGMNIIQGLEQEVEAAQLASRFRRDVSAADMQKRIGQLREKNYILTADTTGRVDKDGEAGYKKAQLLNALNEARQALLFFSAKLKDVVTDFEMSKLDDQEQK